jgi:hypothetical protein
MQQHTPSPFVFALIFALVSAQIKVKISVNPDFPTTFRHFSPIVPPNQLNTPTKRVDEA